MYLMIICFNYYIIKIADNRDGTYTIALTPNIPGILELTITIDNRHIRVSSLRRWSLLWVISLFYFQNSPFTFLVTALRPHAGIFHCCSFCSSKGNKKTKCSCNGRMPGYNGCGHGHAGHPGQRHWSCCANTMQNSECSVANRFVKS